MADGQEMLGGSTLAVAELNARGGIGGRPVRHVVEDVDLFDADDVAAAFGRLAAHEVDAITSGYLFAEDAAREAAAAYGAPYLHAMTSESQLAHVREAPDRYGNVFQVCPSESHYGPGFVSLLDDLARRREWRPPNRTLLFLETPLPSGQMVTPATADAAEQAGWQLDLMQMPALDGDLAAVVARIHRRGPAAVIVTQFLPSELARFQRCFAAAPSETLVCAVYTPSVPEFAKAAGEAADGLIWATVNGTYGDPLAAAFHRAYRDQHGRPPGRSHAGIAYDSVHLLAQAWGSVANPRRFREVAASLRRTAHRGVNGAYYLGTPGQSALSYPNATSDPSLGQAHLTFQIQDRRHRILAPHPYADAAFRMPRWFPPSAA